MVGDFDFNYSGGFITVKHRTFKVSSIDGYFPTENSMQFIVNGTWYEIPMGSSEILSLNEQLNKLFNPRELD